MRRKVLATAPTIERLTRYINEYFCSTKYTINAETLAIEHPTKTLDGYGVKKTGNRYQFIENL